jgi:hypothetical protein
MHACMSCIIKLIEDHSPLPPSTIYEFYICTFIFVVSIVVQCTYTPFQKCWRFYSWKFIAENQNSKFKFYNEKFKLYHLNFTLYYFKLYFSL